MDEQLSVDGVDFSAMGADDALSARAFTSAEIYRLEIDRVFARSWVVVADTTDLTNPGDFVAAHIGDTPVITVRGEDGEIRTFLNACRHRGSTLARGEGNCGRTLTCPYHAWSYGHDGRLVGIPDREEFSCDPRTMGLVPVRTGVAAPMVFACLDSQAPDFQTWLGDLLPALERAGGASMKRVYEFTYDVDVNWKVYVENGLEGYHVPFVHDMLDDFVETKSARHFLGEHGSRTHAFVKPEYAELAPAAPELREDGRLFTVFGHTFPNLIPVISPLEFTYLRVDPLGPERIRLVARGFMCEPDAEIIELRKESLDRTNGQDIAVVTRVQEGMHARGLPPSEHAAFLELRIRHFERMVVRALTLDAKTSLAAAGPIKREERVRGAA